MELFLSDCLYVLWFPAIMHLHQDDGIVCGALCNFLLHSGVGRGQMSDT